ncbi:hypothetical protein ACVWXO_010566 [Bradyrhizobium sp. LM2.7]
MLPLSSQLATGLSAHAPAQRAGAQRLCALARRRTLPPCPARRQSRLDRTSGRLRANWRERPKSISELLLRAFYVVYNAFKGTSVSRAKLCLAPHSPELSSRSRSHVSPRSARTALRSATASLVKRPCLRAFRFPLGAPHLAAPPCIRQRVLPCTAGAQHAPPSRVLAPQRGLARIAAVLRAWRLIMRWQPVLRRWVGGSLRRPWLPGSALHPLLLWRSPAPTRSRSHAA